MLTTAQSPAFVVVDRVTGLNLDHLKFCPLHYGSDCCRELLNCVATNCEEFRENDDCQVRKVCRHHDWT